MNCFAACFATSPLPISPTAAPQVIEATCVLGQERHTLRLKAKRRK